LTLLIICDIFLGIQFLFFERQVSHLTVLVALEDLAHQVVERSNGEKVDIYLEHVNRRDSRVTLIVPSYNARFVFVQGINRKGRPFAVLAADGRQVIDPTIEDRLLHVSQSIYAAAAQWAWAILTDYREEV